MNSLRARRAPIWPLVAALLPLPGAADTAWWERTRDAAGAAWEQTLRWVTGQPAEDPRLAALWDDLVPKLDETLSLVEASRRLPESRWFGRDREDARQEINQLLDEAVDILARSDTAGTRRRIRELEGRIAALQRENDDYRLKRIAAPREALWEKTMAEYDAAIADNEARIAALRKELAREKRAFAESLDEMGLRIDPQELDVLLASVTGDDLIQMAVVFDNVKRVTTELERLMVESGQRMEATRRYYGMYTVLLRILVHLHETAVNRIRAHYLPRIQAIVQRTEKLRRDTRHLLRETPAQRRVLEANLRAQDLTLEAAAQYRAYLNDQAAELERRLQDLRRDLRVAQNTYDTVKVSGELLALMRSSRESLAALARLDMPPLRGFDRPELRDEFRRLTEQLRVDT